MYQKSQYKKENPQAKITVHEQFKNLDKLLKKLEETDSIIPELSRQSKIKEGYIANWCKTKDFEEAVHLAQYGWEDGYNEIMRRVRLYADVFNDLLPRQELANTFSFDVAGESVDVGRYLEGTPEAMQVQTEETNTLLTSGNKLQRIFINVSLMCSINSETIFNYGAMTLTLVNALEGHGFRTEVIVRYTTGDRHETGASEVLLCDVVGKQFTESPDYNKLAFLLAHPSFERRIGFAWLEILPEELHSRFGINNTNGYTTEYSQDMLEHDFYMPKLYENMDLKQTIELVRNIIGSHFKNQLPAKE